MRTTTAAPEVVFAVLSDHAGMSGWTPLRASTLEREGDPAPNGVGAIRALKALGTIREEIMALDPPREMSYRILSGLPVRDHRATVQLLAEGAGTRIVWSVTFVPKVPGIGFVLHGIIGDTAKKLAAEAERRVPAA